MKNFGILPIDSNPSTSQIIIPGAASRHNVAPFRDFKQLELPFEDDSNEVIKNPYCNSCKHFIKEQRPGKFSFNTKCGLKTARSGNVDKIIKLGVYQDEKVKKPFWCPIIVEGMEKQTDNSVKIGNITVYPARNKSAMSDEQLTYWERAKLEKEIKEKWLAIPGIIGWDDIKISNTYHLPPTINKKRMTIRIKQKYVGSIQAEDIKTGENVWLYKNDEEYKFMSVVK